MDLKKLIKNIGKGYKGEYQSVLGSEEALIKLGQAWEDNAESIHLAVLHLVNEFALTEHYDKIEMKRYRQGITDLASFIEGAWKEYKAGQEKKLKKHD